MTLLLILTLIYKLWTIKGSFWLLSNILPTRGRLATCMTGIDTTCPVCDCPIESTHHILLECVLPKTLWWHSKWQIKLDGFQHLSVAEWIFLLLDPDNIFPLDKEEKHTMTHFLAVSVELCWMTRNKKLRGESTLDIPTLCNTANRSTAAYSPAALCKLQLWHSRGEALLWLSPPSGFMKINFDASYEDSNAFIGILLRNSQGIIIRAWTGCSTASSPYVAEAEAALQALKMA